jgi:hypothetical protein
MSYQWNKPADFPAINPTFANKKSRFIYAGGASGSRKFLPYFPFDSVVKVDVSDGTSRRWSCEGRKFVGEPVFIPTGGGEDHGYVIIVEVRPTCMQVPTFSTYVCSVYAKILRINPRGLNLVSYKWFNTSDILRNHELSQNRYKKH